MNIIFDILIFAYSTFSFFERKVFIKGIGNNDLVLDIGSGDKPFWRADVVVDKYLRDDQQRHSGPLLYDRRKFFVEGDAEKLPFKDKVFDFVFCSHLLEHVKNPDKAINELTRVAKRGYIEVPDAIVDLFEPFPPHLWFCQYKQGTLIFQQKEQQKNFFTESTERFGKDFFRNSLFQYLLAKYDNSIFVRLYWSGSIRYKIIRAKKPYIYRARDNEIHVKNFSTRISFVFYKLSYLVMTALFYKRKKLELGELLK